MFESVPPEIKNGIPLLVAMQSTPSSYFLG
jgi:hypothetical protein